MLNPMRQLKSLFHHGTSIVNAICGSKSNQ